MEGAALRRLCRNCGVEKPIDQFYDLRGNGNVVTKCLKCRNHDKALVRLGFVNCFLR
jgi:hypothetical protein